MGEKKKRGLGPLKWRNCCGRKHRTRERCLLMAVTRTAKSGRKVTRYTNPSVVK
jgi:hypothetical protein